MTAAVDSDAIASLTGALVDANDRLLGMLALVAGEPPDSLAEHDLVRDIIDRAEGILPIDATIVAGDAQHRIGAVIADPVGTFETDLVLEGLGELSIAFQRHGARFDTGDVKILNAVARLVGQAVATARRHAEAMAQEAIAQEHAAAARVIAAALPSEGSKPEIDGATLFASLVAAKTVGGDLYSWRRIGDELWFAIGDVSGKGLPAAVLMSVVCNAIDSALMVHHGEGPVGVIDRVGQWVHGRMSDSAMFVTLAIGSWNTATGSLRIANAGHSPIVFHGADGGSRVDATAPPIGVLEGLVPDLDVRQTAVGDSLVMATDGCSEQLGPAGTLFGEDRFDELVVRSARAGAGDADCVGSAIIDELEDHRGGVDPSDDRTLVVVGFDR